MLTYNMDVEERSVWLRATPNNAVLAQPFYATEAGLFYGRSHFATARTDKESYILFYTLAGAGLIEQNEQHIELPQGAALLMNCRTPQSYCTAPGYDVWEHYWVHLDGVGVKTLADSVQSQGRLTAAHVSRMEMQPLFETLFAEWKKETTTAQIEIGLTLHKMLALLAHQQLSGDESRSNRTMIKQIADYMYHSRTDPKLEYLVEKYGDEFVATEYGSIQSTRFPGLYVNLRWSEEDQTYIDNYIVYLRREDLWAILAPAVQEIYDDCKVFIAPYTPSPDFDKNTTAEELLTTFGLGRNPVVSLWIYTKDDTAGKDTDMQQLTSKIQAMGYSVDVGVYYLSEENYEVVNEDDYLNYNIGVHQDFYEYFENVYIYPDSFELILSDWKEESSK